MYHPVCVRAPNALEAVRGMKHLIGSLLKMLMHSGCVGQLAKERLAQTPPGPDIRYWEASVSQCLPGTSILPSLRRVNAALPVRQISLNNTRPRKQHNDLQVDGRSVRGKRKEEGMVCVTNQSLEERTHQ